MSPTAPIVGLPTIPRVALTPRDSAVIQPPSVRVIVARANHPERAATRGGTWSAGARYFSVASVRQRSLSPGRPSPSRRTWCLDASVRRSSPAGARSMPPSRVEARRRDERQLRVVRSSTHCRLVSCNAARNRTRRVAGCARIARSQRGPQTPFNQLKLHEFLARTCAAAAHPSRSRQSTAATRTGIRGASGDDPLAVLDQEFLPLLQKMGLGPVAPIGIGVLGWSMGGYGALYSRGRAIARAAGCHSVAAAAAGSPALFASFGSVRRARSTMRPTSGGTAARDRRPTSARFRCTSRVARTTPSRRRPRLFRSMSRRRRRAHHQWLPHRRVLAVDSLSSNSAFLGSHLS